MLLMTMTAALPHKKTVGLARALPLALLLVAVLVGCAPRLQPLGSANQAPQLLDNAIEMSDGIQLPVRTWLPKSDKAKAVAVALHGFNDHSAGFDSVGPVLQNAGIAVYAIDQRGFGRADHRGIWAGVARMTADLNDAVTAARGKHPGLPAYAIGESMGGAVVMAALNSEPKPDIDGAILIAPAVWGRESMNPVQTGALWLLAHSVPWLTLRPEGLNIEPSDNIEMLRALSKDPYFIKDTRVDAIWGLVNLMDEAMAASENIKEPLFLLYGERDEIVPKSPTCAVIKNLSNGGGVSARFALYPNGYHMLTRDLKGKRAIDDMAAWMQNADTGLPSDAEVRPDDQRLEKFCD